MNVLIFNNLLVGKYYTQNIDDEIKRNRFYLSNPIHLIAVAY